MRLVQIDTIRLANHPRAIFVALHTDDGLVGYGETYDTPEAVESYIHDRGVATLLGKDPLAIDKHWDKLHREPRLMMGKTVEVRALSALDVALWDLFGKATNLPIWQLLGGLTRDKIRVYNTCAGYEYQGEWGEGYHSTAKGSDSQHPYEDLYAFLNHPAELAKSLISEGYSQMKIWPFDHFAEQNGGTHISLQDLKKGLEPFKKIREAVGDQIEIAAELHNLWSLPAAIRISKALEDYKPVWIEDPIPMDNPRALASFRASTSIPVCASETIGTRWGFREMFELGALDIAMLDVTWTGGISEARKIATMAEVYSLPVAPHDCVGPFTLAANIHLCMNLPNAMVQEVVRAFMSGWYKDVSVGLPEVINGYIHAPHNPGLGVQLKPEVYKRSDAVVRTTTEKVTS